MYALYFLLVTIVCVVMMSPTVEELMKEHVSGLRNVRASPYKNAEHIHKVLFLFAPSTTLNVCCCQAALIDIGCYVCNDFGNISLLLT